MTGQKRHKVHERDVEEGTSKDTDVLSKVEELLECRELLVKHLYNVKKFYNFTHYVFAPTGQHPKLGVQGCRAKRLHLGGLHLCPPDLHVQQLAKAFCFFDPHRDQGGPGQVDGHLSPPQDQWHPGPSCPRVGRA